MVIFWKAEGMDPCMPVERTDKSFRKANTSKVRPMGCLPNGPGVGARLGKAATRKVR